MTPIVVDKSADHAKAHFDLLNRVRKSLILATEIYRMQDIGSEINEIGMLARVLLLNSRSLFRFKAGVNVKAVLTLLNTAFLPISRSFSSNGKSLCLFH